MNATDYKAVLRDTLLKMGATHREKERLEVEAAKLRQFFRATLNMLPDGERNEFLKVFQEINEKFKTTESSLKDAIYNVLREEFPEFLTATDVRDHLRVKGFDFSGYTSNELASVSTTLRRFKPEEVETTSIEGVAAYRQNKAKYPRMAEAFRKGAKGKLSEMK
jgi:hypothetical protein